MFELAGILIMQSEIRNRQRFLKLLLPQGLSMQEGYGRNWEGLGRVVESCPSEDTDSHNTINHPRHVRKTSDDGQISTPPFTLPFIFSLLPSKHRGRGRPNSCPAWRWVGNFRQLFLILPNPSSILLCLRTVVCFLFRFA